VRGFLHSLGAASGLAIPDLKALTREPIPDDQTSGFGWREDPINHNHKFHNGTDFRGKHGTPVYAAGDGVVIMCSDQNGYGNVVFIDHGGGVVTRYAHLSRFKTKKDAVIKAGDLIGLVGSTGRSTGPHLHFEVRIDGNAVDPVTAMAVAELQRESPSAGQIAAYTLSPDLQNKKSGEVEPAKKTTKSDKRESRPERSGRSKRVRPVS
jgi:murein DD-endopeptidase MepM/ murein hydrolase activator NlpD